MLWLKNQYASEEHELQFLVLSVRLKKIIWSNTNTSINNNNNNNFHFTISPILITEFKYFMYD